MNIISLFRLILIVFLTFSCSTKKSILYLQGDNNNYLSDFNYEELKIVPGNILKVDIFTENPEISLLFNPKSAISNIPRDKQSMLYDGYMVSPNGNINLPVLGSVRLLNSTITEARKIIYDLLVSDGFLKNPTVDIKILNNYYTIIGEVNQPGRYEFIENNINIFEAIGKSGDLTINGSRKDVKIIRDYSNKKNTILTLDLTKSNNFSKQNFQIFPGDIIIVNPNISRIKNAGIIGNAGNLLSLLSFILSSIIVISR